MGDISTTEGMLKMDALDSVINTLERVKRMAPNGEDFWMGRDIQSILGYDTWESFYNVIQKSMMGCESAGFKVIYHFRDTTKMISGGKGAKLQRADCYLTRYACYLVAMNGDSRKAEISTAQSYFAAQTRRQELRDQEKRIALRDRVRRGNSVLAGTAINAGVQRMAIFTDAGYRGLYGMGLQEIKSRKKLAKSADLLDRAGHAELAANEFRITQTQQKLERERIQGEALAIATHRSVGAEVRDAINRIGGTMPENLPLEEPIKKVIAAHEKRKRELVQPSLGLSSNK
jgi:DNA-damage-inducible protein D